jgi:DNA modification methylase
MQPFLEKKRCIYNGDCRKVMLRLIKQGVKVDSIVCDPPYNIGFMNKAWDSSGVAFEVKTWRLAYRLLKPGGHLLAFSGTRTYHRMVCAIEDAGFEVRDQIAWVFGSGFPKSNNISKCMYKEDGRQGAITQNTGKFIGGSNTGAGFSSFVKKGKKLVAHKKHIPKSAEAIKWEGFGTALKPAFEPIVLARKPLSESTIVKNVLKHGTGAALNIDACRIPVNSKFDDPRLGGQGSFKTNKMAKSVYQGGYSGKSIKSSINGRWPANFIHDGSNEVEEEFAKYGITKDGVAGKRSGKGTIALTPKSYNHTWGTYGGQGSASRFFYSAKANKKDRLGSKHPTVKPIALMEHLINMVNPIGGTVLDPFCGSGTAVAASLRIPKSKIIGIELQEEYLEDIERRVKHHYDMIREAKNTLAKFTHKLY